MAVWERACSRYRRYGLSGKPWCMHREQARSHIIIGLLLLEREQEDRLEACGKTSKNQQNRDISYRSHRHKTDSI